MNVIVCIKQVPAKIKIEIDPKTGTLASGGVDRAINPPDLYALEEGLRIKEKTKGKVTVLTMGPAKADESLKEAIGYGADEAILLSDPAFEGSDTWATSHILAKAIKKIGQFDLVICGKQSIDGETGQVGPMLAEALGVPFVSLVNKIEELGRRFHQGHADVRRGTPVDRNGAARRDHGGEGDQRAAYSVAARSDGGQESCDTGLERAGTGDRSGHRGLGRFADPRGEGVLPAEGGTE